MSADKVSDKGVFGRTKESVSHGRMQMWLAMSMATTMTTTTVMAMAMAMVRRKDEREQLRQN
ncbi:hypothetical protein TWF718_006456 [Orbilia javanica]|uniref:Uncharacterized protein n=1 Tax=Orbilia javanica TaxID=47235 RepID=A0AAN8RK93_9PEZI